MDPRRDERGIRTPSSRQRRSFRRLSHSRDRRRDHARRHHGGHTKFVRRVDGAFRMELDDGRRLSHDGQRIATRIARVPLC